MSQETFLVELGTEELPPKALRSLSKAFAEGIEKGLNSEKLSFSDIEVFATPRRLAVKVNNLLLQQPDQAQEKLGPAVKAAFDSENNPTPAAIGFAASCKTDVSQLETTATDKGDRLVFRETKKGMSAKEILPAIVSTSLHDLPIPKKMHWSNKKIDFVRPVHWLIMLLGKDIIPCAILGLDAGRETQGHRFHGSSVTIERPEHYESQLLEQKVIANFADRQEKIRAQVLQLASELQACAVINPSLLEEVTALVEWPVALAGNFDESFLAVPQQALIAAMEEHQKYFSLTNDQQKLLPHFITVSNVESRNPEVVIKGNERVIRPRLADADFFFRCDKQKPLAERLPKLASVIFQKNLGSLEEKSQRIAKLAEYIAKQINADSDMAYRAGLLSKADLTSDMVTEFSSLQGIAGRYYAAHDGENPQVATAIEQHYWPRFAKDKVPVEPIAIAVALADRIDTLCGIFAIGQKPTGSKDPFALRRASLGVLRIIIENKLSLNVQDLLEKSLEIYGATIEHPPKEQALTYIMNRFRSWYEEKGFLTETFLSVEAQANASPLDFDLRMHAVQSFQSMPEAGDLAQANKRVANILSKNSQKKKGQASVNHSLLKESAEKALTQAIEEKSKTVAPLIKKQSYTEALQTLANLNPLVDSFFEQVMVNVEDEALKQNRLQILFSLQALFLEIADISLLATKK